jgi:hypothetical protein
MKGNVEQVPGAPNQASSSFSFWPVEAAASQMNSQEPLKMNVTGVRK